MLRDAPRAEARRSLGPDSVQLGSSPAPMYQPVLSPFGGRRKPSMGRIPSRTFRAMPTFRCGGASDESGAVTFAWCPLLPRRAAMSPTLFAARGSTCGTASTVRRRFSRFSRGSTSVRLLGRWGSHPVTKSVHHGAMVDEGFLASDRLTWLAPPALVGSRSRASSSSQQPTGQIANVLEPRRTSAARARAA